MAEVLFARMAPGVEVGSAGTLDWSGQPAHEYAIAVMAERGLDLSAHRSRRLSHHLVDESDLIVAMTRNHGWAVAARNQERARAVFLPAELSRLAAAEDTGNGAGARQSGQESNPEREGRAEGVGNGADAEQWVARLAARREREADPRFMGRAADEIPDPIGESLACFRDIADRLERELAPAAARLHS